MKNEIAVKARPKTDIATQKLMCGDVHGENMMNQRTETMPVLVISFLIVTC